MPTFVLVPGAWLGSWAWKKVVPLLEARGNRTFAVTLTGTGERYRVATKDMGVETAIKDVLDVLESNDLRDVVLVGHSLAGKMVAAAADRAPERVGMVMYVDAFSPEKVTTPQGSFPDEFPVDGLSVPFPVKFLGEVGKDVQGADRDWLLGGATSVPVRYFRDPIVLSDKFGRLKSAFILCSGSDLLSWYLSQSPGRGTDEVLKEKLDGPYRIVESGHWPMVTKPAELATAMMSLAAGVD